MSELENSAKMSMLDVFGSTQETFEEAKKKSSDESRKSTSYFRMAKDGTYNIRVLPLAPVQDAEGNWVLERKGYEYPTREFMLKFTIPSKTGKDKPLYLSVCDARIALKKQGVDVDLIDTYLNTACDLHADDEAMCKKLRANGFSGGLKFDSRRCMYVLDMDDRKAGIQLLSLSYSNYKDIDDRKLATWEKSRKNNPKALCPISSPQGAYPLEVTRKTENSKTSYSFNIDIMAGLDTLSEEELTALIEAPRLPDLIYNYRRRHLEATIEYLKQLDARLGINVMEEKAVKDCIEKISMCLPSDDTSHFSLTDSASSSQESASEVTLNSLWAIYDSLEEQGLPDQSEAGQELRTSIREYIDSHNLDIKIRRSTSNYDILCEIEALEAAEEEKTSKEIEEDDEPLDDSKDLEKTDTGSAADEEDDDYNTVPHTPAPQRRPQNEDTAEPAVRPSRRAHSARKVQ